jgi:putative ABC transport system permease protein
MAIYDVLALAVRNLRRRRGRSILTAVAVALGSALLVALVAISATADTRVVSQLSKGGPLAAIHVDDSRPGGGALQSDDLQTAGHHNLDAAAVQAVRRSRYVSAVVAVLTVPALAVPCPPALGPVPASRATGLCAKGDDPYQAGLVGADLTQAGQLPITVLVGRLPAPHSFSEVAVTETYLDHLQLNPTGATSVLGTRIEFGTPRLVGAAKHLQERWFQATIVGVVAQSVESGDFLVPIEQTQAARAFAMTGNTDSAGFGGIASPNSALIVIADRLDHVHAVRSELFDLGFASSAPEHLVASVLRYLHVVDIVLAGIGVVAVAIAVLGIANSLLAAVRERWRDIGVLKAIGADDRDVLLWFLIEAAILGAVGGVAGTVVGLAVAAGVGMSVNSFLAAQGLQGVDLRSIPVQLVVLAPLGTALLAMVAGALPAMRAARLPAREAMGAL